ncbi:MAG: hypothetical protein Alpg2KO_16820 [Alphaproteobacteria bacterium]
MTATNTAGPQIDDALSRDAVQDMSIRFRNRLRKIIDTALGDAAETASPELNTALFVHALRQTHARQKVTVEDIERLKDKPAQDIHKLARRIPKAWPMQEATALTREAKGAHGEQYSGMFNTGEWRRYYPMPKPGPEHLGASAGLVIKWLEEQGFTQIDYIAGTCVDDRNQTRRIGRVLPNEDYKSIFANDPERQGGNLMLVISRHPYDLIRMSTGRGWQSCMSRGGVYSDYLPKEVAAGSMVAYLAKPSDPELMDPLARVTIKPYENQRGDRLMMAGPVYGMGSNLFRAAVQSALDRDCNPTAYGKFKLSSEVYSDGMERRIERKDPAARTWTAEQWIDHLGLEVDAVEGRKVIRGDLDLIDYGLTKLPDFSDYELDGSLHIQNNTALTSLKGCPHTVRKAVIATGCGLTSLEGSPRHVGAAFNVSFNMLTSLKGGPETVQALYNASDNALVDLSGSPRHVSSLNVSDNKLATLKGAPERVKGILNLSGNRLTGVDGLPVVGTEECVGLLNMSHNRLTSLQGLIGRVEDAAVDVSYNKDLTSLDGCPKALRGALIANHCALTGLTGGPRRVGGDYIVKNNAISALTNAPEVVDGRIDLSTNPIRNLAGLMGNARRGVNLSGCGLTSLKGLPREFAGSLDVTHNKLTTLEGMPERIGGDFLANHNQLTSTRGMAAYIGQAVGLSNNRISELVDMPGQMSGNLTLGNNALTSTRGLPPEVGGYIILRNNPITDATEMPHKVGDFVDLRENGALQHMPAALPKGCDYIQTDRWNYDSYRLPCSILPPKPAEGADTEPSDPETQAAASAQPGQP